jgi:hypothetical protein
LSGPNREKLLEEEDKLEVEPISKPTYEPSVVEPKLGESTLNKV